MVEPGLIAKVHGLHRSLAAAGVPHAFGGALALAYCTEQPRGTIDIDVNLFVVPEGAGQTFAGISPALTWTDADVRQVERDGQVRVWSGSTPVDLFFSTDPFHDDAARHARVVPLAGVDIPVLGCDHLAVLKAMFGRTKDWADLEAMAAASALGSRSVEWLTELLGGDDPATHRLERLIRKAPGQDDPASFRRRP